MAYGVGKAGCDRMAADCAFELRKSKVAMISLWPGPVKTEFITENVESMDPTTIGLGGKGDESSRKNMAKVFEQGESIEFSGKVCAYLAAEGGDKIMSRTGKIINTADVAREYGFTDIDGSTPVDFR